MNIPNILTFIRIILVPVYLQIFYSTKNIFYAGLVFALAGLTDALDGRIARKYNMTSKIGAALDPLADKLMTFAVLISFTSIDLIPHWVVLILGIKEVLMILGGLILYLFKEKRVLPSNKFGKSATVSFYVTISAIVIRIPFPQVIKLLIIITVALNIIAFLNYLRIFISNDSDEEFIR
ncbi:MAG: CDP-alcohol phosphatidyltransferase family protein [Tissierellales bacterium]